MKRLTPEVYDRLEKICDKLQKGLEAIIQEAGIKAVIQRVGSMLTLFFHDGPVKNMADASSANHDTFSIYFSEMLKRGIHLPPSGYEAWFISTEHSDADIEKILNASKEILIK